MQGIANVISVEPPMASQKTKENCHILDVINDNHQKAVFVKAQHSRVSIQYIDQPACQMPNGCDYNMSISANIPLLVKTFSKTRVGTMIKIAPQLDPMI
jgi:hypothetical protein